MRSSRPGSSSESHPGARPFLKWAGGKRQLLPELRKYFPSKFDRYFEPFLGSGAVFFDLYDAGRLANRDVILLDNNPDLIGCYSVLRREAEAVIRMLEELSGEYGERGSAFFYEIRDHRFNPMRARLFAGGHDPMRGYTPELAAMLIFLNRTGYNGLFRLNSEGRFNVPEGRYERPRICDADNLRRASDALNAANVTLLHGHFDLVERLAGTGDFLYFDPPYAPVSPTSRFTSYTARQFGRFEQNRLHGLALELSRRGCHVVVSNSTAAEIRELYWSAATRAAGLQAISVQARRAINSKGSRRGEVTEFILANTRTRSRPTAPRVDPTGSHSRGGRSTPAIARTLRVN
jgi:DNA adenine methylase